MSTTTFRLKTPTVYHLNRPTMKELVGTILSYDFEGHPVTHSYMGVPMGQIQIAVAWAEIKHDEFMHKLISLVTDKFVDPDTSEGLAFKVMFVRGDDSTSLFMVPASR